MLTTKLILERLDRDYQLLERREQKSRSFVRNFINLLYCAHAQILSGAPYSMNDITNTPRNIDTQPAERYYKGNLKTGSAPGSSEQFVPVGMGAYQGDQTLNILLGNTLGIQVGTGVGLVSPTDIALGTKIAHGRAAGQFEYGGCELVNITFAGAPNGEFTIRRYFTNLSGGGITVNEAGIYVGGTQYNYYSYYGLAWPFCIARDLVVGGVLVNNTELLRVTYVVQITV